MKTTPPSSPAAAVDDKREGSGLSAGLRDIASLVDRALELALPAPETSEGQGKAGLLREVQRYAVLGGGKRVRGCLAVVAADLFKVPRDRSIRLAAGIECLHAYSLVHDDLPAMDGDDMRRGQPTVHRTYGEALAILAGDALHSRAFEIVAGAETHPGPGVRARLAFDLARAAGEAGMAGGQALDMAPDMALEAVRSMQSRKTGALFQYSCASGGVLGEATEGEISILATFGRALGQAYQIRDDLLDVEGDSEVVGKRLRKDSDAGKTTLVNALGREGAVEESSRLRRLALEAIASFGDKAERLREMIEFAIVRQH